MGLFNNQFANVIEWNESRDDVIFWLWRNKEIKRGSRLVIRPGQDAIFLYNGKIEGIFKDEGNYEIESEIIPFLTTLKGFKFGFNSPLRAEVLFVNTKEFLIRWGTKSAINIPTPSLKGGLPIRSFGTFTVKVNDYLALIDRIAGVKQQFTVEDVKERVLSQLDQLLMRWISKEGKDLFNFQVNAYDIARGIKSDLDMELLKLGLTVTDFTISSFTYPENVEMMKQMTSMMTNTSTASQAQPSTTLSCHQCGHKLSPNVKFCPECGTKVQASPPPSTGYKFCPECGTQTTPDAKFCNECGHKLF